MSNGNDPEVQAVRALVNQRLRDRRATPQPGNEHLTDNVIRSEELRKLSPAMDGVTKCFKSRNA